MPNYQKLNILRLNIENRNYTLYKMILAYHITIEKNKVAI
jgi:hypothetical protein